MSQALTKINSVRTLLNSDAVKNQIAKALPQHLTAERMIRVIMTGIQKTPKLAECSQHSLVGAIVQASELGLEPNTPLGLAYIIPYGSEATFQIGYRGFLALARRSGEISYAVSEIVREHDRFELYLGSQRKIVHVPLLTGDRGDKIGVYSLVVYKDGTNDFEYMTREQVLAVKKRSKASSSGPWVTDEDEMWRKTPMRRHAKRWPMAVEDAQKVVAAAIRDEYTDFGVTHQEDMLPEPPPAKVITEGQRVLLVEAAKKSKANLSEIVENAGFKLMADITVDAYDGILAAAKVAPEPPDVQPEQTAEATGAPDEGKSAESQKEDWITAISDSLKRFTKDKRREILAGRDMNEMSNDELAAMYDEVAAIA